MGFTAHHRSEEEGNDGVADGIEEVERDDAAQQNPPRAVAKQGAEVAANRHVGHGTQPFARQGESEEEKDEAGSTHHHHCPLPTVGVARFKCQSLSGVEVAAERFPAGQYDERTTVGKEHTIGGKDGFLVGVGRHHTEHRTIRHVDGRVDGHHEQIGHVSPNGFDRFARIGGSEEQHTGDGKRSSHPKQIGAVLTPAGLRAVGQYAHHRVAHGVPNARHQHKGGSGR